jgi:hypothetical protein
LLHDIGDDPVEEIVAEYPRTNPPQVLQIAQLQAAFEKVLGQNLQGATAYNTETCVEFHQLLIAVLRGYRRSLSNFRQATKVKDTPEIRFKHASMVWTFSHLLWRIAFSQVLRYHLITLDAGQLLSRLIDSPEKREEYKRYVIDPFPPPEPSEDEGEDMDEDVDEELQRLRRNPDSLFMTFLRWIWFQVCHFTAQDILSRYSTHGVGDINVQLLSVRISSVQFPAPLAP